VAVERERQIKSFGVKRRVALFCESNPAWKDLNLELFQTIAISRYARDSGKKDTDES
jgi:hypothetical protein